MTKLTPTVLAQIPILEAHLTSRGDWYEFNDASYVVDHLCSSWSGVNTKKSLEILATLEGLARKREVPDFASNFAFRRAEILNDQGECEAALEALNLSLVDLPAARNFGPYCAALGSKLLAELGRFEESLKLANRGVEACLTFEWSPDENCGQAQALATLHGQRIEIYRDLGIASLAGSALDEVDKAVKSCSSPDQRAAIARDYQIHQLDCLLEFQVHGRLIKKSREYLADATGSHRAELQVRLAMGLADLENRTIEGAAEARQLFESLRDHESLRKEQKTRCLVWLLELDLAEEELDGLEDRFAHVESLIDAAPELTSVRPITALGTLFEGLRGRWMLARAARATPVERNELILASHGRLQRTFERVLLTWEQAPQRSAGIAFLARRSRRLLTSQLIQHELLLPPAETAATRALNHIHRIQAMGTFATQHAYEPLPLTTIQSTLCTEERGLLVYLTSDRVGHLFCIGREQVVHVPIRGEAEWWKHLEELRSTVQKGPGSSVESFERQAAALGDDLLPKAARDLIKELGWKSAYVVGGDYLVDSPFEYFRGTRTRWLYQELDIAHLKSMPFGVILAQREAKSPRDDSLDLHLVVANREQGDEFPFTDEERRRMTQAFEGRDVVVHAGSEATLEAIQARLGKSDGVFHLVAHGKLQDDEMRPSVLLAGSQRLTPELLLNSKGAPRLAVLSVCRASLAHPRVGDDAPIDLGHAYLAAGSQAAVSSRYRVEYEAQATMAPALHRHLLSGLSPARALALARDELAADPRFSHPFHGMVQVVGLGHSPVF